MFLLYGFTRINRRLLTFCHSSIVKVQLPRTYHLHLTDKKSRCFLFSYIGIFCGAAGVLLLFPSARLPGRGGRSACEVFILDHSPDFVKGEFREIFDFLQTRFLSHFLAVSAIFSFQRSAVLAARSFLFGRAG
jgi:hypothetical protein